MSVKEAKRSPNFNEGEKTTLINLVYQFKSVLETKKTDSATNQKKSEVWKKLAYLFNATSGRSPRDVANLRSKYDDLKKNLRKKMGNNKREIYKTGGGAASISNLSPDEELLLSLIGPSTVGMNDRGGGDRELPPNLEHDDSIEILESELEKIVNETPSQSFRASDAIDILKRPIQTKLTCNDVETDISKEDIETSNTFATLECYEKPKTRKRKADKLDELIEEYADLKEDRKRLLHEQTKYFKEKNERETQIFNLDLQILKMQKEELEVKLKKLKESC